MKTSLTRCQRARAKGKREKREQEEREHIFIVMDD
jgi:hypothetical protein